MSCAKTLLMGGAVFVFAMGFAGEAKAAQENEDALILSSKETNTLLDSLRNGINQYLQISMPTMHENDQAVLLLVRNAAGASNLAFLPGYIGTKTVSAVVKLATLAKQIPEWTMKEVLDEIEKATVKEAVKIGTDWLLQNEVLVSSGEISAQYASYDENDRNKAAKFQYIVTISSFGDAPNKKREALFEIRSSNFLSPPLVGGQFNSGIGWMGPQGASKDFSPFIMRIRMSVEKNMIGEWAAIRSGRSEVSIEFKDKVERLELSSDLPYPIEEAKRDITNKLLILERLFERISGISSKAGEAVSGGSEGIVEFLRGIGGWISARYAGAGALLSVFTEDVRQNNGSVDQPEEEQSGIQERAEALLPTLVLNEPSGEFEEGESAESARQNGQDKDEREVNTKQDEVLQKKVEPKKDKEKEKEEEIGKAKEKAKEKKKEEEKKREAGESFTWCAPNISTLPARSRVIFNEIAWMGSTVSHNDEWMELKNLTSEAASLTGWQIINREKTIAIRFEDGGISAHGYYLLERTDDDSVPGVKTDIIYTGALRNDDEELYLFDASCVLHDRVLASPWPAGDNKEKKSMERASDLSWHTYNGGGMNTVLGTPKEKNSEVREPVAQNAGSFGSGSASAPSSYPAILITEIQHTGAESAKDEFIELYNPFDQAVDLSSWRLAKKTVSGNESNLVSTSAFTGRIGPGEHFLVVPQNEETPNTTGARAPDLYYSGKTYSIASNNTVILYNPLGEISDKVGYGSVSDADGDPAPDSPAGYAIGRSWGESGYYGIGDNSSDFSLKNPTPGSRNKGYDPPVEEQNQEEGGGDENQENDQGAEDADEVAGDDENDGTQNDEDIEEDVSQNEDDEVAGDDENGETQDGEDVEEIEGGEDGEETGGDEGDNEDGGIGDKNLSDQTAPSAPSNLVAEVSDTFDATPTWSWSASTDEESDSTLLVYEAEWSALASFSLLAGNAETTNLSFSHATPLEDGVVYFRVRARDEAGNKSGFALASREITSKRSVVINEIAWMGTSASYNDEWIELKNATDSDISLEGWLLKAKDGTPSISLSGSVEANGFYLLERTDESTISTIEADLTYTGALGNDGEKLLLYDANGNLIDAVDARNSWMDKGNNTLKISMERISASESGSDPENWKSNNLVQINGEDADGNAINGTPRSENSVSVPETLITWQTLRFAEFNEITLTLLGSPYKVRDVITVPEGKTLRIEPGVTMKMGEEFARLDVAGTLKAEGTSEQIIAFTSYQVGGTPSVPSWCGIKFLSSSADSVIKYATIEKATSKAPSCVDVENPRHVILADGSSPTISHTTISNVNDSRSRIFLRNSSAVLENLTLPGSKSNSDFVEITVDGGSPSIISSLISGASTGIAIKNGATPVVQGNTFSQNTVPILVESGLGEFSLNAYEGNGTDAIVLQSGTLASDLVLAEADAPYLIDGLTIASGATLTIEAGVVVAFEQSSSYINVEGVLLARGSEQSNVVFRGKEEGGRWGMLYFTNAQEPSVLEHTLLNGGGMRNKPYGKNPPNDDRGAVDVENGKVELYNVVIQNGGYNSGIYSQNGDISGSNVDISGGEYAFNIKSGPCPTLSNVPMSASKKNFKTDITCVFPN